MLDQYLENISNGNYETSNSILVWFNKYNEQIKKDLIEFITTCYNFEQKLKEICNNQFWLEYLTKYYIKN